MSNSAWSQDQVVPSGGNPSDYLVEVEQSNVLIPDLSGGKYLVPYRVRRTNWSVMLGLQYSLFAPTEMVSDLEQNQNTVDSKQYTYADIYGATSPGLMEINFTLKRNFKFGSLAIEGGAGSFSAKGKNPENAAVTDTLSVIPIFLGAKLYLDTLFYEPYVVPFFGGGVYQTLYTEEGTGNDNLGNPEGKITGETMFAPYASVGVLIQLNWMDPYSAAVAYDESGLENAYILVEGRMMMASPSAEDTNTPSGYDQPDFSSMFASVGFVFEF